MNVREFIQELMKLDMDRKVEVYNEKENKCYYAKINTHDHEDYIYIEQGELDR